MVEVAAADGLDATTFTTRQDETVRTIANRDLPPKRVQFRSDHQKHCTSRDTEDDDSDVTTKEAGLLFRRSAKAEEFDDLFAEFQKNLAEAI